MARIEIPMPFGTFVQLRPLPDVVVKELPLMHRHIVDCHLFWRRIGDGLFGYIFENDSYPHILVKKFDEKSYENHDEHRYDYEVLIDLQDIDGVPTLYGYAEHHFAVLDRVPGKSIEEWIQQGAFTTEMERLVLNKTKQFISDVMARGWITDDLLPRHVFYDETDQSVHIVDYGKYQPVSTFLQSFSPSDLVLLAGTLFQEFLIAFNKVLASE